MYIDEYFKQIEDIISRHPAVLQSEVSYDRRALYVGFVKGLLVFSDTSELHFKEFIDTEKEIVKYRYAYHYQKCDKMLFRYDNHLGIHHKHISDSEIVEISKTPELESVLDEILLFYEER